VCTDLDLDGDLDVAVSDDSGFGEVSVLLNFGDGTFAPPATCHVGGVHLPSLASADFDGDGFPDLAVATTFPQPHTIAVLTNRGDGTFAVTDRHPVPNALAVASADLDGDGRSDLAVTSDPHSVSVLLNGGDGTFRDAGGYSTGERPSFVAAADLDGDGRPELVVANLDASTLSVLRNRGSGRFDEATPYEAGSAPIGVATRRRMAGATVEDVWKTYDDETACRTRSIPLCGY
jgi:hypothetical protein